jgi:hypothetical protein
MVNRLAILFLSFGLLAVAMPGQTVHSQAAPKSAAVKQAVKPAASAAQPLRSTAEKVTPKTPYDSTQGQLHAAKMENLHFEFEQTRQKVAQDFQQRFDAEKKAYDAWAEGICKTNGWNCKEYQYDPKEDIWYHILPAAAPATPPAK